MNGNSKAAGRPTVQKIFIHIPKTAGTFLRGVLERQYGELGCVYPTPPFKKFEFLTPEELDALKRKPVVIGHESYHAFSYYLDGPAEYYTVMRNPVDRLISYYNHSMSLFDQFKSAKVTPLKFLENRTNHEIDNLQLRYLSGNPVGDPIGADTLAFAKDLVSSGTVNVGIQEFLSDSCERMPLFDKKRIATGTVENKSNFGFSRHSLTAHELDAFRARCYWDIKLYEFCLEHFRGQAK